MQNGHENSVDSGHRVREVHHGSAAKCILCIRTNLETKPRNPKSNSDLHVQILRTSSHRTTSPSDIIAPKTEVYPNPRV
jgi:hypothetical protein